MNPRPGLLACAIVAGCFRPTGSTDTSNPTISTGLSSSDDAGTDTSTSDTETSGSTVVTVSTSTGNPSTTTSTTTAGGCGDDLLEQSEECDDGNQEAGDGCSTSCTKEFRRVFVTSQVWSGDLGGLAGADQKCQDAAEQGGLPGIYKAWLSSDVDSPASRFVHSTVPYQQINGVVVASNWDDLIDGTLQAGIVVSELSGAGGKGVHGCMPAEIVAWTNTRELGTPVFSDKHCSVWSSTLSTAMAGRVGTTSSVWTQFCEAKCVDEAALYCFEQ